MLGFNLYIVMKSFEKKMYNAWTYDSYPVMAAILFFIGCPKSSGGQSDEQISSYRVHKQYTA